jgi:hypothetical protein
MADESSAEAVQELLARHREARRRREMAALGGEDYRAAAEEIARIEIEISRLTAGVAPQQPERKASAGP